MNKNPIAILSLAALFFILGGCASSDYTTTEEDFCDQMVTEYCYAAEACGWANANSCEEEVRELTGCWRQNYCGDYQWQPEMADRCIAAMKYKSHQQENGYCSIWDQNPDLPWACQGRQLCR